MSSYLERVRDMKEPFQSFGLWQQNEMGNRFPVYDETLLFDWIDITKKMNAEELLRCVCCV
jgi:hypothetical protein